MGSDFSSLPESLRQVAEQANSAVSHGIRVAKSRGLKACQVTATASDLGRIVIEQGHFSLANTLDKMAISIVVHHDDRKGSASINQTDPHSIEMAIDTAATLASFAVPDPALNLPDPDSAPTAGDAMATLDPALPALSLSHLADLGSTALRTLREDRRVSLDRFEISRGYTLHFLQNTYGVSQWEAQSTLHWDALGFGVDGANVGSMYYDSGFAFQADQLEAKVEAFAHEVRRRILEGLSPRQAPSYDGVVILSPRAVDDLLLETILYHASGASVMDRKSRWIDKVGETVASPLLSVTDFPHDRSLAGTSMYDTYGVPTRTLPILEKGRLRIHLHDCYSAKRTGSTTTASGGGPFALHVLAGDTSQHDLVRLRPKILWIDRFSGNTDPITGDFSGVAKNSRYFENGTDQGSVTETMVAGNTFDLLQSITAVGRETSVVSGHYRAPAIAVDGVAVTGADSHPGA